MEEQEAGQQKGAAKACVEESEEAVRQFANIPQSEPQGHHEYNHGLSWENLSHNFKRLNDGR